MSWTHGAYVAGALLLGVAIPVLAFLIADWVRVRLMPRPIASPCTRVLSLTCDELGAVVESLDELGRYRMLGPLERTVRDKLSHHMTRDGTAWDRARAEECAEECG